MKKSGNYSLDAHYGPEVQHMLDTTETCLTCGTKLSYIPSKDRRRNRGYCCQDHYYAKPPKLAYLEYEFKKPAREVILDHLNRGLTVTAVAELMGVGKCNFYKWLHKLNIRQVTVWK